MNYSNLIKLSLFTFVLFGCKDANEQSIQSSSINQLSINYSEIEIDVPEVVPSNYLKHQVLGDSLFIGLNAFKLPYNLVVFNIKKQEFVKRISIDPNFFKNEIESFYAVSLDSIFFNSFSGKSIYLINSDGQKIKEWDVEKMEGPRYPGENGFFFSFSIYPNIFYDKTKKKLLLTISDNRFHEEPGFSQLPKLLVLDLESDEIEGFWIPPFGRMKSRGEQFFPDDLYGIQMAIVGDFLYISTAYDDLVLKCSLNDGKILNSGVPIEMNELFSPLTKEEKADNSKLWDYRVKMPFFEDLSFHESLGIFSRIFHHEVTNPSDMQTRKSTIVTFDQNLNLLETFDFQGDDQIGIWKNTKLTDGILMGVPEEKQISEDLLNHYRYLRFVLD